MQEENVEHRERRLIDEALASEPIKNTFRLAWEFIQINQKFTFTLMGTFITLHILGVIPILSLLFGVFAGVFGFAIQIYVGKLFYSTRDIGTYVEKIEKSKIDEVSYTSIAPAFGAYLGLWTFLFILFFLFGVLASSMGLINEGMNEHDLMRVILSLAFPLSLVLLTILYVQPLIQANIALAKNFNEGFKAIFSIFSSKLWKKVLNKAYFVYVVLLGIIVFFSFFILLIFLNTIANITGLAFFTNIILLGFAYIVMIIMGIGAMMAKRIVE